jgi:uncharacterized protein YydD (DUF2326 family)
MYDCAEVKSVVQKKEQEISDLKVKIDELKTAAARDMKAREEMQLHYQQRLRERQAEIEQYRWLAQCLLDHEK